MRVREGLAAIWVIIIVILALVLGAIGGYYYFKYKSNKTTEMPSLTSTASVTPTSTSTTATDTSDWKTLILPQGEKIKYPQSWTITKNTDQYSSTKQITDYKVNCTTETLCDYLDEYNVAEWFKGPDPNEGYVMSKEDRTQAVEVFKNIYKNQKISSQDLTDISKLSQEVLGYSSEYRTDLKYFASSDNKFRGLSFINTRGQDHGISPIYEISVYNPDKNVIINLSTRLYEGQYAEIDKLNAKLKNVANSELEKVDKEIHQEFEDLVKNNTRSKYSFGAKLNEADQVMKTLTY